MIKNWLVTLLLGCAVGCGTTRTSRFDEFEKATIDKMTGNEVSGGIFQKTLLCLNALRETHHLTLLTNLQVTYQTNHAVVSVTNMTVTRTSQAQVAMATNLNPSASAPPAASLSPEESASTNRPPAVAPPVWARGATLATNSSESVATSTNQNVVSGYQQITTAQNQQDAYLTNDLSITQAIQQTSTLETNYVVTTYTNAQVAAITNVQYISTNVPAYDYYLYTEIIPPPDFVPHTGESLVVLVNGARHSFASTNAPPGFVARKGFLTTFYKTTPAVLVAIANAQEVKVRVRGNNTHLERRMSSASQNRFREFLLATMQPKPPAKSAQVANRE